MPTIFVTNPLQALQVENQRLRRENERLRQQIASSSERRELDASSEPATVAASAQAPPPARSAPTTGSGPRTPARPTSGPVPRPMIHLIATDGPIPSVARPIPAPAELRPSRTDAPASSEVQASRAERWTSRAEPEALDDAAARFRLLELD
jgi:cell division septum initiation protein DivIVA